VRIFDDPLAERILTPGEYEEAAQSMARGIGFFDPDFKGGEDEALRRIADSQLSPTPLGRAAFSERMLENAVRIGARQYLILGAGYDTFAWRQPPYARGLQIIELDHPLTSADKRRRVRELLPPTPENVCFAAADFAREGFGDALRACPGFDPAKISFCSLPGLVYYLTRADFAALLAALARLLPEGSALAFDYPDRDALTERAGVRARRQAALAAAAGEPMRAGYSYEALEKLLEEAGFGIYEHLDPAQITAQYFGAYNRANPEHRMTAFDNVNYCLAVRQRKYG